MYHQQSTAKHDQIVDANLFGPKVVYGIAGSGGAIGRETISNLAERAFQTGNFDSIAFANDLDHTAESMAELLGASSGMAKVDTSGTIPVIVYKDRVRIPFNSTKEISGISSSEIPEDYKRLLIDCTGATFTADASKEYLRTCADFHWMSGPPKFDDALLCPLGWEIAKAIGSNQAGSATSCTTNCLLPMVEGVDGAVEIANVSIVVAHAPTNSDELFYTPDNGMGVIDGLAVSGNTSGTTYVGKLIKSVDQFTGGCSDRMPLADDGSKVFVTCNFRCDETDPKKVWHLLDRSIVKTYEARNRPEFGVHYVTDPKKPMGLGEIRDTVALSVYDRASLRIIPDALDPKRWTMQGQGFYKNVRGFVYGLIDRAGEIAVQL